MNKITFEMVEYWLSGDSSSEIISMVKDIANEKYSINMLKRDIVETNQNKDCDIEAKTIGVE